MKGIATFVCFLALAGSAQAGRYDPYLKIGREKFPATCWPVTVEWWDFPEWAAHAGGLAYPDRCLIRVPLDFNRWTKQDRCETLVHEVGHLSGISWHSSNPRSVMYTHTNGHFKPCQRFRRRTGRNVIEG
jgi:hypothetical protein